ncbi:uncharacterized protein LOC112343180 [Selaginella moellendorffii]|uniref:uncharacterized protein LOC112343180 n=1 Tax=Selaginella moellendorffii TaxID=88036 RepID=UPI000D1C8EB0|nr:uncharacterized protein LOC112343180 [Selaginella moellendorffii]|eukprot:XP_024522030.1 uncharacterized protein LOC112343180 [Selaginella moellendorffii]
MDHARWVLYPAAAHEEQGSREEEQEQIEDGGFVSIALTGGAELAEFKARWRLPLFSGDGLGSTQLVELRSKSGICVDSVEPFSFAAADPRRAAAAPSGNRDDGAGVNSATKLRLLEGLSGVASPIVLKSRGVIQAERRRRMIKSNQELFLMESSRKTKQRAVSMDDTSLNHLHELHHHARKKLTSVDDSAKNTKKSSPSLSPAAQPLPLPPPPGNPARNHHQHHRRHLSIDLRASPAAKFVVQVMPWEISSPSSSSSLLDRREHPDSSRRSMGSHCFVPFKWEEVPGKPKNVSAAASTGNALLDPGGHGAARKLQLPPRLQHQDHEQEKQRSLQRCSPTSTLDRTAVEGSSSASSPRIDASFSSATSSCSTSFAGDGDQAPRWIRALLALHIWETVRAISRPRSCEDEGGDLAPEIRQAKKKNALAKKVADCAVPYPSWSPAPLPRSSWFQRSPIRSKNSRGTNWAFGKIAWRSCNMVKRAVRFRWWSLSRSSRGFHSTRKNTRSSATIYKPLLCRVDGDSSAFGCSTARI